MNAAREIAPGYVDQALWAYILINLFRDEPLRGGIDECFAALEIVAEGFSEFLWEIATLVA